MTETYRYGPGEREQTDFSTYKIRERQYRSVKVPANKKGTKHKLVEPDLSEVIDFESPQLDPRVKRVEGLHLEQLRALGGCTGDAEGPIYYEIEGRPGFYFVEGALSLRQQARWARTCLTKYSRSPHTNLTNLHGHEQDSPWKATLQSGHIKTFLRLRWANLGLNYIWSIRQYAQHQQQHDKESKQQQQVKQQQSSVQEEGPALASSVIGEEGGKEQEEARDKEEEEKGSSKDDNIRSMMPISTELTDLARAVASPVGFTGLHPEAGIVNYYPSDAMMGGHVDDAEGAVEQPIVSLSIGLSCVYLLGGLSKEEEPLAMFFRSGDAMVMGREARHCYHGVPCVLADTTPSSLIDPQALASELEGEEGGEVLEEEVKLMSEYLKGSRINFNVRQVFLRPSS